MAVHGGTIFRKMYLVEKDFLLKLKEKAQENVTPVPVNPASLLPSPPPSPPRDENNETEEPQDGDVVAQNKGDETEEEEEVGRVERAVSDNVVDDDVDDGGDLSSPDNVIDNNDGGDSVFDDNRESDEEQDSAATPLAPSPPPLEDEGYQDYDIVNVEDQMTSTPTQNKTGRKRRLHESDEVDDQPFLKRANYRIAQDQIATTPALNETSRNNNMGEIDEEEPLPRQKSQRRGNKRTREEEEEVEEESQLPLPPAKRVRQNPRRMAAKRKAELTEEELAKRVRQNPRRMATKRKAELTEEEGEGEDQPPVKRPELEVHTCPVCGDSFSSHLAQEQHFNRRHQPMVNLPTVVDGYRLRPPPPAKERTCQLCGDSFQSSTAFNKHILKRHQPTVSLSQHKHLIKKLKKPVKRLKKSGKVPISFVNEKDVGRVQNLPPSEFARFGVARIPVAAKKNGRQAKRKRDDTDNDDDKRVRKSARLQRKRQKSPGQQFQELMNSYKRDTPNY